MDMMSKGVQPPIPRLRVLVATIVPVGLLLLGFAGVLAWFNVVDFYNKHFFDTGLIVVANQAVRVLLLGIVLWAIYAVGAFTLPWLHAGPISGIPPAERAVAGFSIGIAIWHVALLFLGVGGLYTREVAAALVGAVLVASALHFAAVARAACRRIGPALRKLHGPERDPQLLGIAIAGLVAAWLMVTRGLYPGGGGDYYTHYFYFGLEVLKNHDLAPNDVWYHFYYSRGYGLSFLGMLLSDPEAPGLMTFGCMLFGALALAVLARRVAPASLWPACIAGLYLAFYIVGIALRGEGELQKGHERVTALIVILLVSQCLAKGASTRLWTVVTAACGVSVAIIAQPFGAVLAVYFGLLMVVEVVRRRWNGAIRAFWLAATIGGAIAAMMGWSYAATGLPTDQALDFMLRFANIERLDAWGVLPQIALVAWIRDNYLHEAQDWVGATVENLRYFLRLNELAAIIGISGGLLAAALVIKVRRWLSERQPFEASLAALSGSDISPAAVLWRAIPFTAFFAAIAVVAGHGQAGSFERASTFFFPLFLVVCMALSLWASARIPFQFVAGSATWQQPVLWCVATVLLWSASAHWLERTFRATVYGLSYMVGRYSLATAYQHIEDSGLKFGGINPEALKAYRQVPPGTPIWSTTIDAYCMVPGCWMESVASFKMSGRLDEIVTAAPERSKQLLKEAGYNYFLVLDDAILLVLLPYSPLFSLENIGTYFGLKWSDGVGFLLTWREDSAEPISDEFFEVYWRLLSKREHPWFRFSKLVPQLPAATQALRDKGWGEAAAFPWRLPPPEGTINVLDATLGMNCRRHVPKNPQARNKVSRGNYSEFVREACAAKESCTFTVDIEAFGDPANGCEKDFSLTYRCWKDEQPRTIALAPSADNQSVSLDCLPRN